MKILQISSAQTLGGGERHLADLANGLVDRGHDVYVAVRSNSRLIDELKHVSPGNITALPLRNAFDVQSARTLAKLVRSNGIQIVHAHMARDYPLAAYAARANPGAALIVTRHVLFPLTRLHRITLAKAARVIAVSAAVAAQLRSSAIVSPEKISVVLNGIDTERFANAAARFDRSQFLAAWKLPEDSLLVGTVGELSPLKGQEEFLRAASRILQECPTAYFIIAGIDHSPGQKHRESLEQLIEDLSLTERVKLVGWLKDLAQLYCGLDVFVSASHTESFGLALAEAMASGTAVVATATEGAAELIQTGETGLLVLIGDVAKIAKAIIELLRDNEMRVRLGQAGQEAATARFTVERMVAETEELYRLKCGKQPIDYSR
ncbi:MAG TPA: glycosyltransferase family 4 protein [Pyrinomonadaceae bacterium]|nr:glycosyltransferase family 4 protein [Pyrinomonadaceae bacterium]